MVHAGNTGLWPLSRCLGVSARMVCHRAGEPLCMFARSAVVSPRNARTLWAVAACAASSRARSSMDITSSTCPSFMIASQVNGGEIDSHTVSRTAVTTTVAGTPCRPVTETLRGIHVLCSRGANSKLSRFGVFTYFSLTELVSNRPEVHGHAVGAGAGSSLERVLS